MQGKLELSYVYSNDRMQGVYLRDVHVGTKSQIRSSATSNSVKGGAFTVLSNQVNERQKATYASFLPAFGSVELRDHLIRQEEVVKLISSPFRYPKSPEHDSQAHVQGSLENQRSPTSMCCCCCCRFQFMGATVAIRMMIL